MLFLTTHKTIRACHKILLTGFVFTVCLVAAATLAPRPVQATCFCCTTCQCVNQAHSQLRSVVSSEHNATRAFFGTSGVLCAYCGTGELGAHEAWLIDRIYLELFLPAMMEMTEQLSAVMMQQMFILGTFFDADHQLDVQRLLQRKEAEVLKDYREDAQICHIGTMVRSLAATEQRGEVTRAVMNEKFMARQLGNANVASAEGPDPDKLGRLEQFRDVFCDRSDNNRIENSPASGLGIICNGAANPAARLNSDIDYTGTVELPRTLGLEFGDTPDALDDDEETLMAMSNYLYGHDLFTRPTAGQLARKQNQSDYMGLRSVVAKRSVAENSFNAIAALKTKGGAGSADTMTYMSFLLGELGMTQDEIDTVYGTEPSYMAQMEILSKNMYQRPEFYAQLQGTVANVDRKKAAMDAIGVMLKRDIYESRLRSEMILSIMLELDIIDYQEEMENFVNSSIRQQ